MSIQPNQALMPTIFPLLRFVLKDLFRLSAKIFAESFDWRVSFKTDLTDPVFYFKLGFIPSVY